MKNFTNTMKYITIATFAVFAFVAVLPTQAKAYECWSDYGPYWRNCSNGGSNNNNNGDDDNSNNQVSVSTLSVSNVDTDSATLRGEINDLDTSLDYERFFEWGTSSGNLNHTTRLSGTTDNTGSFSKSISGLNDDDQYFYRACAEEDGGGDNDCGSIKSFWTDSNNGNNNNNNNNNGDDDNGNDNLSNDVITAAATGISAYTANLNGLVINDGGSQTIWFEWGTTVSLGHRTPSRNVSGDRNFVSASLSGLTPGQTYFFRIVSSNGDEGVFESFVTTSISNSNGNNGGSGSNNSNSNSSNNSSNQTGAITNSGQFLKVGIKPSLDTVAPGDVIDFAITYENLTSSPVKNIKLVVDFPEGINVESTEVGKYLDNRKVELDITELVAKAKGSFVIKTSIDKKAMKQSVLVAVVDAIHTNPLKTGEWIETSDYTIVKISKLASMQSASAFGAGSFFPHTILGWILLVILIALIIVLARTLYKKHEDTKSGLQIKK